MAVPQPSPTGIQVEPSADESQMRYPFYLDIDKYVSENCLLYADSTQKEMRRKLYRIARLFDEAKEANAKIDTDPKTMKDVDVVAFINLMRKRNLDPDTQRKYLHYLNDYLASHENLVLERLKKRYKASWPRGTDKPQKTLSLDDLNKVLQATANMKGWKGDVARFACLLYSVVATRPTELRSALLVDLNTEEMTLTVGRPKGGNIYGRKRILTIPDIYTPSVYDFLKKRAEYLASNGILESKALIPYLDNKGEAVHWYQKAWTDLRGDIVAMAGVRFTWQELRATCSDILIDYYGNNVQDVSVFLGHSSTRTTEKYYARIKMGKAQSNMEARMSETIRRGMVAIKPIPTQGGEVQIQNGPSRI